MSVRRRAVLAGGLMAGSAATFPAPALAQGTIRWRLASGFPRGGHDLLADAADGFCRQVAAMTDGRIAIAFLPEPATDFHAALAGDAADVVHTIPAFAAGRDPAFALLTAAPFGLNARGQAAWLLEGGGLELANALFAKHDMAALPGGNTGAQMGGWFKREIRQVDDLKGLRIRAGGLGATVLARLGAETRTVPGPEIRAALEAGTLDAAEWIGPHDDEKLGLARVAPVYHYPGWQEGAAQFVFAVAKPRWDALPAADRAILSAAAASASASLLASYDSRNPSALRRLVGAGAQLRPFPPDVMDALFRASGEVCEAEAARSADFRTLWDAIKLARNEHYLWAQVAEYNFDNFMIRNRTRAG